MRRLSLCCSICLGVVFDPRSHTRYELMSRNWYMSFCWTWYQEKRGPCRSIPDKKSKTIRVPGGRFYLHFELSPSYAQDSSQGLREFPRNLSPYYPQNSAYTDWFCSGGSSLEKKGMLQTGLSFLQIAGFENLKKFYSKIWTSGPLFLYIKICLFLKTEMDNPPSYFTFDTMQSISIDWYPEISTFMLYVAVNATWSPPPNKKRLTGVVSKMASHPWKSGFLGVSR
jgi:hypothetical protein